MENYEAGRKPNERSIEIFNKLLSDFTLTESIDIVIDLYNLIHSEIDTKGNNLQISIDELKENLQKLNSLKNSI